MYHETTNTAGPADSAGETIATITPRAFAFDSQALRVVEKPDGPWFVAADVGNCLGIENHHNLVAKLDPDEKGLQLLETLGGTQEMSIISEPALYFIMIRCNGATKPGTPAHTFRRWVTHEVLPTIRRTGGYGGTGSGDALVDRARALLSMGFGHDTVAGMCMPRNGRLQGQKPGMPACPLADWMATGPLVPELGTTVPMRSLHQAYMAWTVATGSRQWYPDVPHFARAFRAAFPEYPVRRQFDDYGAKISVFRAQNRPLEKITQKSVNSC